MLKPIDQLGLRAVERQGVEGLRASVSEHRNCFLCFAHNTCCDAVHMQGHEGWVSHWHPCHHQSVRRLLALALCSAHRACTEVLAPMGVVGQLLAQGGRVADRLPRDQLESDGTDLLSKVGHGAEGDVRGQVAPLRTRRPCRR